MIPAVRFRRTVRVRTTCNEDEGHTVLEKIARFLKGFFACPHRDVGGYMCDDQCPYRHN
jgi:hypothetical protein